MTGEKRHTTAVAPVPWATEGLWAEAQAALRRSLVVNAAQLAPARRQAAAVAHGLDCLADLFDLLTPTTCAVCRDPCCRHAKVWIDFKDLLFLHLHGVPRPSHQLRRNLHEPCRYLGHRGCRLPRLARPWICTWYICPDQRQAIQRDIPGGGNRIENLQSRVKSRREAMEAAFLDAVGFGSVR